MTRADARRAFLRHVHCLFPPAARADGVPLAPVLRGRLRIVARAPQSSGDLLEIAKAGPSTSTIDVIAFGSFPLQLDEAWLWQQGFSFSSVVCD